MREADTGGCHDGTGLRSCEERLEPAEAFAIVGNETLLAILEALRGSDDRPARFSELRRRVGTEDSPQFNFYLGKLAGPLVRKADDGYGLRETGRKVVSAILAGSFTEHPEIEPFEIDGPCAVCGATLRARYGDERLAVEVRSEEPWPIEASIPLVDEVLRATVDGALDGGHVERRPPTNPRRRRRGRRRLIGSCVTMFGNPRTSEP